MKEACAFCGKEINSDSPAGFSDSAHECKYCGKKFCGNHDYFTNHNCEKVGKEKIEIEKKTQNKEFVGILLAGLPGLAAVRIHDKLKSKEKKKKEKEREREEESEEEKEERREQEKKEWEKKEWT